MKDKREIDLIEQLRANHIRYYEGQQPRLDDWLSFYRYSTIEQLLAKSSDAAVALRKYRKGEDVTIWMAQD
jgi:hypothetical protein